MREECSARPNGDKCFDRLCYVVFPSVSLLFAQAINDPFYNNGSQYYVDLINATGAWKYTAGRGANCCVYSGLAVPQLYWPYFNGLRSMCTILDCRTPLFKLSGTIPGAHLP